MAWWKGSLLLVLLVLLVVLSGCCCGGSDTETKIIEKQPVSTAPLGEELIKLQEARDKGALSEKEYEDAKARLLKQQ